MKNIFLILLYLELITIVSACNIFQHIDTLVSNGSSSGFTFQSILLFILGIYEVIIRIIPTFKSYSLIALIISVVKLISDYLDKKKKVV